MQTNALKQEKRYLKISALGNIRVIQPGRQRLLLVHVVLPGDYEPGPMASMDTIRRQTYQALRKDHVVTAVDIVFTADRW